MDGSYASLRYEGHTVKYSGIHGRLLWDKRRVLPAASPTILQACAGSQALLDPHGNIVAAIMPDGGVVVAGSFIELSGVAKAD